MSLTVWTLFGFADKMRCEFVPDPSGMRLCLWMGPELIKTERLNDVNEARIRAEELKVDLLSKGWIQES